MITTVEKCLKRGKNYIDFGSYYDKNSESPGILSGTSPECVQRLTKFVKCSDHEKLIEEHLQGWIAALKQNEAIHQENLVKIEKMKSTIEEIHTFMLLKGITKTYSSVNEKSRARVKPRVLSDSGYILDIRRVFNTSDDFFNANDICKKNIENTIKLKTAARQRVADITKEKINKNKMDKRFFEVAKINEELGNPITDIFTTTDSIERIIEELVDLVADKNNALSLADAMRKTRGNWNDGCSIVEHSLFAPTNEEEKEMISCVQEAIESFHDCQDGRVFRDCEWNYDQIYLYVEKTDPATYALYNRITNIE